MPFVELDQLAEKEYISGFRGRTFHSPGMTFVHWNVDAGATLPDHAHPHEQVVNVLAGEFRLTIDGESAILTAGRVAVIPPHARHSGEALTACRIVDVFHPVREDYR